MDRLFAERAELADDLPHFDPVMVRLWSLCDVWAAQRGGVLLQGEVGSGRETLGRLIHERSLPHAPFVVMRSAVFDSQSWRTSVERAQGGTLYVRHLDALPGAERASFWEATAFRPMASVPERSTHRVPVVLAVPALRDRPMDILPIAEHVLAHAVADGLPKPGLSKEIRRALSRSWINSIRDLKNALLRAALLVDGSGEILPEHMNTPATRFMTTDQRDTDLRLVLRATERRTLLETLGRTNWNVTEAARLLGLPRRTVVYRMSRLGLKRTVRSS